MIDTGVTCNLYINFTKSASTCGYCDCSQEHDRCLSHSLLLGYVIQKNQWGSKDVLKQEAVKQLCVESACEYIYTVGVFDWLSRISRFLRESQGWLRLV